MDKDELFRLAVQLVLEDAPVVIHPGGSPEISLAVRIAYNGLVDAYKQIPEEGLAPLV